MALIPFRGQWVLDYWPEEIEAAQKQRTFVIVGGEYERIPYGSETRNIFDSSIPCHDCAVIEGELHVDGCDVEECPRCGGQNISCNCNYVHCDG